MGKEIGRMEVRREVRGRKVKRKENRKGQGKGMRGQREEKEKMGGGAFLHFSFTSEPAVNT